MYKITSSGTFIDPHNTGVSGIIFENSNTPSLSSWKYIAQGTDHCAEFLVSNFSGGGGGFGAGSTPLPVEVIKFKAQYIGNYTSKLN